SDKDISKLVDIGATSFGFNIEIWDDTLRKVICEGKSKIPKSRYLSAMKRAYDILGPNRTGSCLIVGLEPVESSIRGANELASIGVQPCMLPFKPWNNSAYSNHPHCSPEDLIKVSKEAVRAIIKNNIFPE